jgi:hypothetical protein
MDIDSAASSEGHGKYIILTLAFLVKDQFFGDGISTNKGDCHPCRIINFSKMPTLKYTFG